MKDKEKSIHIFKRSGHERTGVRASQKRSEASALDRFTVTTEIILSAVIVVIVLFMVIATDTFLTEYNIVSILKQSSVIGIIAISSTFVIISGGIDLSVGSLVGLTAMVQAVLMSQQRQNMNMWVALAITLLTGIAVGVYHGFIIYEVNLPPFIATLGSMFVLRGVTKVISEAQTVSQFPKTFTDFAQARFIGAPSLVIVWFIIALLSYFILNHTRFGRNIYVIGSSKEVASLSGIRMRINTYSIYSNNSPSNKYTLLGTVVNEIEIAGVDCRAKGCADRFWLATVCHPSSLE